MLFLGLKNCKKYGLTYENADLNKEKVLYNTCTELVKDGRDLGIFLNLRIIDYPEDYYNNRGDACYNLTFTFDWSLEFYNIKWDSGNF